MKPDKLNSKTERVLSDATTNTAMGLFLTVFTVGTALLIWRSLSPVPEGGHWIDQVLGAMRAISTVSAALIVLYGIFAANAYGNWAKRQFRLYYEQGLVDGCQQTEEQFGMDGWREWMECAEAARREGRLGPEPPSWSMN